MAEVTNQTSDQVDLVALAAELDSFTFKRPEAPLIAELDENGVVILSDAVTGAVKMMMTETDWHALRAYPTKIGPKPLPMATKERVAAQEAVRDAEDDQVHAALDAVGRDD